jgi:hypothetical protein
MESAQMALDKIKMGFGDWLEGELKASHNFEKSARRALAM